MVNKILVALDGSSHAQKALGIAITLAKDSGSELLALNVASDTPLTEGERRMAEAEYSSEVSHALTSTGIIPATDQKLGASSLSQFDNRAGPAVRRILGQQIVNQAAAEARRQGIAEVSTVVESGDPVNIILQQAKQARPDMIVMGSRGFSDIKGAVLGSVSHKVAHLAPCSVVKVTRGDEARSAQKRILAPYSGRGSASCN